MLAFYTTTAQVLTAILLGLTVFVAIARNAPTEDASRSTRKLALYFAAAVTVGLTTALIVLASPDLANQVTFSVVCFPLGIGISAIGYGLVVGLVHPDDTKVQEYLGYGVVVLGLVAMYIASLLLDGPAVNAASSSEQRDHQCVHVGRGAAD